MIKHFIFILFLLAIRLSLAQDLSAVQKVPMRIDPGTDYIAEITIYKGQNNGYLKFTQRVPKDFTAREGNSKGGAFTFKDSLVNIVWITPPTDSAFTISYKVNVSKDATGTRTIKGKITYFFNIHRQYFYLKPHSIAIGRDTNIVVDYQKKIDSVQIPKPIAVIDAVQTSVGIDTNKTMKSEKRTDSVQIAPVLAVLDTIKKEKQNKDVIASVPDSVVKTNDTLAISPPQAVVVDSVKPPAIAEEFPKKTENNTEKQGAKVAVELKPTITASSSLPVLGRTYRVQIGAFKSKPKIEGVPEISTVLLDSGITKYFSGSFSTMEDATKRKNVLIEKGFEGAFIVPFENGVIVK